MEKVVRQLADELLSRLDDGSSRDRYMVGIAGPPGSGKTTMAQMMAHATGGVVVELDGFHRSNRELTMAGQISRKGAPDSFNVEGFVDLLRELRAGEAVRAPIYSRVLHEPIEQMVPIHYEDRLIFVEGNYLLLGDGAWADICTLLDEAWYLDVSMQLCMQRVAARHQRGGCTAVQAQRKIQQNDQPNAMLIMSTKQRADRVLSMDKVRR
ncbi:nucleoside/nucleotide kinase family protein [Planctomycetales bacterium ZRK34]|nr:nucleoside/nucleotide kinase family protein [Planctomycetales bacterium ZRK34]